LGVGIHDLWFHLILPELVALIPVDPDEVLSDVRHGKPHRPVPKKLGDFQAVRGAKANCAAKSGTVAP
jgi:hypothetical protein